jgi:hypothetical protein
MDPLDLLYGPRLDAIGIQSRAKESFKEYYSLNFTNLAGNCVIRPETRAMHVFQGSTKVQETMFPGGDHKGEQPLFIFEVLPLLMGRAPHTPPGDGSPGPPLWP